MKRMLCLLLSACLLCSLGTAAFAEGGEQVFTPGTYSASSMGRNGALTVEVTVDEHTITDIKVVSHRETATLSEAPIEQIPADIIKYQSLDVDAVTGATLTSFAVKNAVTEALKAAGGNIDLLKAHVEKEYPVYTNNDFDVLVVGAGAAGMTAAIRAAEAGAKVLIVEKQGFLGGGDSMFSSTSLRAGGSQFQTGEGESEEDFYNYLEAQALKYRPDVCDLEAVKIYSERSGEIVDWLVDLGAPYGSVVKSSFSVKMVDGSAPGTHNIKALHNRVDELGIEYRVNTRATKINLVDGKVVGVTVEDKTGSYDITAKATIICTGGYSNNTELVEKYAPDWANRPTTGAPSCTGDGILMAEAIGAKITNMDQVKANALCYVYYGTGVSLTAITTYAVLINHQGERFVDESGGTVISRAEALMKQSDHEAYAVFDQTVIDELSLISGYNDAGYFLKADTFEELADQMDVDKDVFLATMAEYTEAGKTGDDKAFGRDITDPVDTPPYYAAKVTPSMQSSYGGITVDHSCHVLDVNDQIIPGLYAAGATSGHSCCAGEVGAALIVAFAFGEIAGETAAADIAA